MIHRYELDDLYIVLDTFSGSVHVVDYLSYEIIGREETYGRETKEILIQIYQDRYSEAEISEAYKEIEALREAGMLFTEDDYKEVLVDFGNRATVVKALCLHVAHDCNLACKYCFAGEGEYHGDRSMMSLEVGKQAIDFLIAHSANRKNLEIDFFGGEPLMNFKVVKEVVIYARSLEEKYNKHFRFTLTTNGVLLNEANMAFMNEHMHNVVLSIDGRKEIHDFMRPASNGQGSYETIIQKMKAFADSRNQENYYVRGTFTHHNLDFAEDVLHLADEGFKQISVEPVVTPLEMPYALQDEDVGILMQQYEHLAREKLMYKSQGKDFNFFHFTVDLSQGPCVAKRISGCGAGVEYLAVTPQGDLYPCHQYVGIEEFILGHVTTGVKELEKQAVFKSCNVYAKEGCQTCWAKFYCSGGCSANAYNLHNDLLATYELGCALEKKRLECAIYLKAKEMLADEPINKSIEKTYKMKEALS